MSLFIPKSPQQLELVVNRLWNGDPCTNEELHAEVQLSVISQGLCVRALGRINSDPKIPDVPIGSRVDGLWEYDVVEVFLVGPGHRYLELELGAGGHYLMLSFDRVRHRSDEYLQTPLSISYQQTTEKTWISETVIPWECLPENLRAINAYAILGGTFLAYSPVPGVEPDFHQPDYFTPVHL